MGNSLASHESRESRVQIVVSCEHARLRRAGVVSYFKVVGGRWEVYYGSRELGAGNREQ